MKRCKSCGTIVPDDSKYCYKCGGTSFGEEDEVSLSDYGASDPYHSVSSESDDTSIKPEKVETTEDDQQSETKVSHDELRSSSDSIYHTLAILSIVFGALGGLLGLILGIVVLSCTKDHGDRKKAIIGISLFVMWSIIALILFFVNLSRLVF